MTVGKLTKPYHGRRGAPSTIELRFWTDATKTVGRDMTAISSAWLAELRANPTDTSAAATFSIDATGAAGTVSVPGVLLLSLDADANTGLLLGRASSTFGWDLVALDTDTPVVTGTYVVDGAYTHPGSDAAPTTSTSLGIYDVVMLGDATTSLVEVDVLSGPTGPQGPPGVPGDLTEAVANLLYAPFPTGTVPGPNALLCAPTGSASALGFTVSSAVVARALGWAVASDPQWAGGAKGGGGKVEDAAGTSGSHTVSTVAGFPSNAPQVGMSIMVGGAGSGASRLYTTITAVNVAGKTITLADPVVTTTSGVTAQWWFDDSAAIQAALASAPATNHGRTLFNPTRSGNVVWLGADDYTATNIALSDYQHLRGNGKNTTVLRNLPNTTTPLITNASRVSTSGNHDIVVSDMTLYGAKEYQVNPVAIIDWAWIWDICKIERCIITRGTTGGNVVVLNGDNLHLTQNHIVFSDGIGLTVDGVHNLVTEGNLFNDNAGGGIWCKLTSASNAGIDANYQWRQKGSIRENYFENNQVFDVKVDGVNGVSVHGNLFSVRDYSAVRAVLVTGGARGCEVDGNEFSRKTGDDTAPVLFDSTSRDCFYGLGNVALGNVAGSNHARFVPPQNDGVDNSVWTRTGLSVARISREIMLADTLNVPTADTTSYARDSMDASTGNWTVSAGSSVARVGDTDPWGNAVTVSQLTIGTGTNDKVTFQSIGGTTPVAGATWSAVLWLKAAADRTPVRIRIGNAGGTDNQDSYRYIGTAWTPVKVTYTFQSNDAATIRVDVRNIDSASSNLVVSLYGVALVPGDRWMFPVPVVNTAVTRTRALRSKVPIDVDVPGGTVTLTDTAGVRYPVGVDTTGKLTGVSAASSSLVHVLLSTITTPGTTTAESTLDDFTIPFANLVVGKVVAFDFSGTLDYASTSGAITLRLYLGAVGSGAVLATMPIATQTTGTTGKQWKFEGKLSLRSVGASSSLALSGWQRNEVTPAITALASVVSSIDLTSGLRLACSLQYATSNASNLGRQLQGVIELKS